VHKTTDQRSLLQILVHKTTDQRSLLQILVHKTTDQRSLWRISGAENSNNTVEAVADSATKQKTVVELAGWLAGLHQQQQQQQQQQQKHFSLLTYLLLLQKPNDLSELLHMKLSAVVSRQGSSSLLAGWT